MSQPSLSNPWTPPGGSMAPAPDRWAPPLEPAPSMSVLPAEPGPRQLTGEVRAGAVTALLLVVLGGPIGLLWAVVRPQLDPAVAALQESAFKQQLSADLRLLFLGLATGAVAGAVAWWVARAHGLGVAVGLAVGGGLAMLLAAQVGPLAAHAQRHEAMVAASFQAAGFRPLADIEEPSRSNFLANTQFRNRAPAVALGMPVAACGIFALLTSRRERSAERPPPRVLAAPVSWG